MKSVYDSNINKLIVNAIDFNCCDTVEEYSFWRKLIDELYEQMPESHRIWFWEEVFEDMYFLGCDPIIKEARDLFNPLIPNDKR